MIVTADKVRTHFQKNDFKIEERFEETGFIYFRDQFGEDARMFWAVERHVYPDTPEGKQEAQLDRAFGKIQDTVNISPSRGIPSAAQVQAVQEAVSLYVMHNRQQKGDYVPSLSDRAQKDFLNDQDEG